MHGCARYLGKGLASHAAGSTLLFPLLLCAFVNTAGLEPVFDCMLHTGSGGVSAEQDLLSITQNWHASAVLQEHASGAVTRQTQPTSQAFAVQENLTL